MPFGGPAMLFSAVAGLLWVSASGWVQRWCRNPTLTRKQQQSQRSRCSDDFVRGSGKPPSLSFVPVEVTLGQVAARPVLPVFFHPFPD